MQKKIMMWVACFGLLVTSCTEVRSASHKADRVRLGATKENVIYALGSPSQTNSMTKTSEVVFGPVEAFWHVLHTGDVVEVWSYVEPEGTSQIYYIQGSNTVHYTYFIRKGVVF